MNLPIPSQLAQASLASKSVSLNVEQAIARASAATVRIIVEEANTKAFGTGTIIDVHGSGSTRSDLRPYLSRYEARVTIERRPFRGYGPGSEYRRTTGGFQSHRGRHWPAVYSIANAHRTGHNFATH